MPATVALFVFANTVMYLLSFLFSLFFILSSLFYLLSFIPPSFLSPHGLSPFILTITHITTGAPMTGVITLIGITDCDGMVDSRLQTRAKAAPVSNVAGSSVRWFDVPRKRRAR